MSNGMGDDAVVKLISTLKVGYDASGTKALKDDLAAVSKLAKDSAKTLRDAFSGNNLAASLDKAMGGAAQTLRGHVSGMQKTLEQLADEAMAKLPSIEARIATMQASIKDNGLAGSGIDKQAAQMRELVQQLQVRARLDGTLDETEQSVTTELAKQARILQEQLKTRLADTKAASDAARLRARDDNNTVKNLLKQRGDALDSLPMLEKQLATVQATMKAQHLNDSELQSQADTMRQQVQLLRQRAGAEGNLTKAEIDQTNELQRQARILETTMKTRLADARKLGMTPGDELNSATALPNLEAQIAGIQARMRVARVGDTDLRAQAAVMREQVGILREKLIVEGKLTAEEVAQVQQLKAQAQAMNSGVSTLASDKQRWHLPPMLQGALLFGGAAAARSGLDEISDIELKMTELARVISDPTLKIDELRKTVFSLAQEFGFSFQQVQGVMFEWASAGYSLADSIAATRSSLVALNSAELTTEQATNGLVGILKQWDMSITDLPRVLDLVSKTADNFSIQSKDLVDGLLKSSGAARNANLTLQQTVAILTAMKSATGQTGANVGNALNSMASFFSREKSLKILEENGIGTFADASQKKLRPLFDVLKDLASNWDKLGASVQANLLTDAQDAGLFTEEMSQAVGAQEEWNDLQKRDLLTAGANVQRRNYLLGLLKNFSQVYEVLQVEENANGYTQRKAAAVMDTYSKKVQQLKAELQELAYSLASDGGLMDWLKGVITLGKSAADWFNNLSPGVKQTVIVIGEVTAAIAALNSASKAVSGKTVLGTIRQIRTELAAIKNSAGAGGVLGSLGAAAPQFLLVAGALAVLTVAVVKTNNEALRLQRQFEETRQASESLIQESEAQAKAHAQNALQVVKLADEYRALEQQKRQAEESGTSVNGNDIAAKQERITEQIEDALGRETAARLKAAGFSKKVADDVATAEKDKAKAADEAARKQIQAYQDDLQAQAKAASASIALIDSQLQGWSSYLTFTERLKLETSKSWQYLKEGWYTFASELVEFMANFQQKMGDMFAKVGWKSQADKEYKAAAENFSIAYEYHRRAEFDTSNAIQQLEEEAAKGPLARQRKLLADLRAEIERVGSTSLGGGNGAGSGDGGGDFGTGDANGKISSIIDGITAETEALGRLNAATEQNISLLQARITYNTREGATMNELRQADADRAELASILTKRQEELHTQAEAARTAYTALADAQAKVNISTDDGKKAYKDLGDAMERMQGVIGSNRTEWWNLFGQQAQLAKENNAITTKTLSILDKLKQKYDEGLISLQQYILGLQALENAEGLAQKATNALNAEQEKAFKQQWTEDIAAALTARKAELEAKSQAVQALIDSIDGDKTAEERLSAHGALTKALGALRGITPTMSMPASGDVDSLISSVMAKFANIDLGALSPDEFNHVIGEDLASLKGFAGNAQDYLTQATDATEARLKAIKGELDQIDADLKARLSELQAQLDALDAQNKQNERDKATDAHNAKQKSLQDQLNWYLLKGADKYAFEIAGLQKQISDEEKAWSDQQNQWHTDDQKQAIQNEMQQARDEAEARKGKLQAEQQALQEQQRVMQEALQALLTYIQSEVATRKKALEDQKKELDDTSKGIDASLKGVDEKVVGQLAKMAAQDPKFYERAQSLIGNITKGIRDGIPALQRAVNDMNSALNSKGSTTTTTTTTTTTSGDIRDRPVNNSGAHAMAEGAWVTARPGGVRAIIGEGKPYWGDELVMARQHAVPMLSQAMATVMRSSGAMSGVNFADVAQAIRTGVAEGLRNVTFYGAFNIAMPDGTIERKLVQVFSGFRQSVRGA